MSQTQPISVEVVSQIKENNSMTINPTDQAAKQQKLARKPYKSPVISGQKASKLDGKEAHNSDSEQAARRTGASTASESG